MSWMYINSELSECKHFQNYFLWCIRILLTKSKKNAKMLLSKCLSETNRDLRRKNQIYEGKIVIDAR